MIHGRVSIFRHLQGFFETELCGVFPWGSAKFTQAEPADIVKGQRKNAFGKVKERVCAMFGEGQYEITVDSPQERPPLGWVTLRHAGEAVEGPLDQATFARIGHYIRDQTQREKYHGTSSGSGN